MGLLKRAAFRGIAHELTRQGLVTWPSKLAEEEAADAVADAMPEAEVPEITDDTGLTADQATSAMNAIIDVASAVKQQTEAAGGSPVPGVPGGSVDPEVNKEASYISYEDNAVNSIANLMQKVAEESGAVGPAIPGVKNTSGVATVEGAVENNRAPSSQIVVPQGATGFGIPDTAETGDLVNQIQPGTTTGSAKLSHVLNMLNKRAADGASLSGKTPAGNQPVGRLDLPDNLVIPGAIASNVGQTSQNIPAAAETGILGNNPAGLPGKPAQKTAGQYPYYY